MGYARALLQKDVREEEASLQKKAKKKSLWGSIGRTLGGLGATLLTGGIAAPWAVGLAAGAGTFAGGALGSQWAGKIGKGKFFKKERESLRTELDPFGEANIAGGLKAGVTAGIGQATKLYAAGTRAAEAGKTAEEVSAIRKGVGFGESFGESFVGRGLTKEKTSLFDAYTDRKLLEDIPETASTFSTFTPDIDFIKKTSVWRNLNWSERYKSGLNSSIRR